MEALIIIDMQEGYIGHKRSTGDFKEVVEYINYISSLFRKEGRPVIFVRDISEGEGEEFCTIPELTMAEEDYEILKSYNNSFWETGLDKLLKELKVEMLVLSETIEGYQAMMKTKPLIAYQPLKYTLKNIKY